MTTELQYFKLRYTFPEGTTKDEHYSLARQFFANLKLESLVYCTFGYETLDKLGKPTHPHCHCHFAIDQSYPVKIGSIRTALQRYLKQIGDTRKGNCVYSLGIPEDVLDTFRVLRYPFKQKGRFCESWEKVPVDFNVITETELANEEWLRAIDRNNKKLEQSLQPNTKDKLFEYLDEMKITPQTPKIKILEFIIIYYSQEEKSLNKQTALGYLNTALIKYGIQTPLEMANEWLS